MSVRLILDIEIIHEFPRISIDFVLAFIQADLQIIAITPGGENNQPCQTYSVQESQFKRDIRWKISTA